MSRRQTSWTMISFSAIWSFFLAIPPLIGWGSFVPEENGLKLVLYFHTKGCYLKYVPFSYYPWCIQSGLSLVKHSQYSKVRTVLKSWDPDSFQNCPYFFLPFITRDNSDSSHHKVSTGPNQVKLLFAAPSRFTLLNSCCQCFK